MGGERIPSITLSGNPEFGPNRKMVGYRFARDGPVHAPGSGVTGVEVLADHDETVVGLVIFGRIGGVGVVGHNPSVKQVFVSNLGDLRGGGQLGLDAVTLIACWLPARRAAKVVPLMGHRCG